MKIECRIVERIRIHKTKPVYVIQQLMEKLDSDYDGKLILSHEWKDGVSETLPEAKNLHLNLEDAIDNLVYFDGTKPIEKVVYPVEESKKVFENPYDEQKPIVENIGEEFVKREEQYWSVGEIYTGDLITLAQEYAERISSNIGYTGYLIEELCNLQMDIRRKIYERLSVAFNELIEREKIEDIEHAYLKDNLKDRLFKIINEL